MKYQFKSLFAEDINDYINLRCQLGSEEDTFARRLHSFDKFCVGNYPTEKTVTQEIAESWCSLKPNEIKTTLQLRTNILRGFLKYLISIGKNAYVIPEGFIGRGKPFVPYLYTDTELRRFFEAADKLPPHPLSPYREHGQTPICVAPLLG
ncbi:MAG: hypothetical protein P4L49_10450 [Desulfosporosinus sp.]|nr:hypothetical protein [Desulfosporosinus sp.]